MFCSAQISALGVSDSLKFVTIFMTLLPRHNAPKLFGRRIIRGATLSSPNECSDGSRDAGDGMDAARDLLNVNTRVSQGWGHGLVTSRRYDNDSNRTRQVALAEFFRIANRQRFPSVRRR
jgi:hypothetical protein